ncbi:hybrid sensor histidine kinase/response regulator [Marinifilum breve]|uniref:histidine kinase n=1 Tax=Marinifilum breve TaxID=2184082 RepID=A0A2V3ZYG9_9BACT|nr:two-component regulator propeller domain-containing protein [Marinifilum breve]PXY01705.1 hybrid sensor histidine kinase/response regulator [Marinifilum breve]
MKKIFLLLVLLFDILMCQAQDIYFDHLDLKDGLSQISVTTIEQDHLGTMWIGTRDGLNRYNGYEIDVFRHDRENPNSLLGNNIRDLKINTKNQIWILTWEGLSSINIETEEIKNYPLPDVNCFYLGAENIWVGSKRGLLILDQEEGKYQSANHILPESTVVTEIYENETGGLFFGTLKRGLLHYNKNNGKLITILEDEVSCVYKSKNDTLWVGTKNKGVYAIHDDNVLDHYTRKSGLAHDVVRDICEDDNGNIWIGTFLGVSVLNVKEQSITNYYQSDKNPNALSHNSIYTMFRDQEGSIWIGTYFGGINIYNPKTNIFRYFVADSDQNKSINYRVVGSMLEDDDKNLWIATEGGGVNFYNRKTKQFKYITKGEGVNSLSHNNAKSLYLDNHNRLWIGTHLGGLNMLDINSGRIKKYLKNDKNEFSIPSNVISAIIPYKTKLILGTNQGVILFDPKTERFSDYFEDEDQKLLVGQKILALLIDRNDRLWIGSESKGLSVHDLNTGKLKNYRRNFNEANSISSDFIYQIYQDHMRRVWVATSGGGLNRYQPESDDFKIYSSANYNLPSDFIYGVTESRYGFLWVATSKGISKFDVEEERFQAYDYENGFPLSEINERGLQITSDGEVFVGGIQGMVSFWEKELQNQEISHSLYFTSLKVNNKEVKVGDETGILEKTLPFTYQINLNYKHSVIEIDFTSFNYLKANKSRYQYRMIGFDNNWVDAGYKRSVGYTNLSPGDYKFEVRETHRDGQIGATTSLAIRIDPPFYNTWWAYIIYLAIVVLILIYVNRMLISKAILEENLKKEQVDKERIRELNQSKLRFFTNISHEFRTPLTLILGQLEALLDESNLAPKLSNKLLVAYKNSSRLKNLIDELLEFRKQELGHMKLRVNEHNFIAFVKTIFDSFHEYAKKRNLNFKLVCHQDQIPLFFDARQMEKVFFNLLSNAFKFTPDGGSIYVLVDNHEEDVVVKVIDSGEGMPSEYIDKIFDRFYQVDNIGQQKHQHLGSGIGLALTKGIVDLHGGKIHVESKHEEGSCFEIHLPKGKGHLKGEFVVWDEEQCFEINTNTKILSDPTVESEVKDLKMLALGNSATVLIVEDNAEVREMLCSSFEDEYTIVAVENGEQGLERAKELQPDLIISDVMMPVMSGTDMCQQLKNDITTSHIPVILLTAKDALEYKIEGMELGADDYITKPFNMKFLQARCRNLIKSRRSLQDKFRTNPTLGIKNITSNTLDAELLEKAIAIVDEHMDNSKFDVNTFAQEMCLGRTSLYAKIKGITGQTPNEFILSSRLKKAAIMLRSESGVSVSEVAYAVGFTTPRYFSKCFSDQYKISPSKYAKGENPN